MWIFGSEENILLKEYSKNPINNFEMDNFTIKYHEGNFICGDDINVFLLIKDNKVKSFSYTGNLSMVSLASAEFISEIILDIELSEVLKWDYEFIKNKWINVSNKRKRAAILSLLAARNAIHQYLDDGIVDDFDDLIDD
jgi:NifU-like protein involved in Fe-S cluster formation